VIRTPRRREPLLAALLAACLLLAGLAPAVSRVLAAAGPALPGDVCHAAAPGGAPVRLPGGHAHPDAACVLCLTHGASHAAPPPAVRVAPGRSAPAARPFARAAVTLAPLPSWLAPPSRGPPGPARLLGA